MKPTSRALILAALALLCWLPACVSGTAAVYPGPSYPPTDPAEVQVYRFFPDAPMERIGEVEVIGATGTDWSNFQEELRKKAASIGGQAVVIVGERNQLLSIQETPSQFQTFRFGSAFDRQSFFFPGAVYPQEESHIVGIVLRFPKGQVPRPPLKPGDNNPGAAPGPAGRK